MNISKSLFKPPFGVNESESKNVASGGNSSASSSVGSTFYAQVPVGARSTAVKATSSALTTAAQNERVQNAAASRVQASMDQRLQEKGVDSKTSSYLSSHMGKTVPSSMNKAAANDKLMNQLSERIVDGSATAAFGAPPPSSKPAESGKSGHFANVPEKSSNGTSVEELKQRLGTLYGQSYTPKYVPSSNSGGSSESRATATGPQSYGGVAPAVNGQQSFVKSSPFLSSSSTFYATASSANSSKNASTGSSWGLSQQPKPHFPNSSSSFGTYSAHATASNAASTTTKFADPFAAFNRPFEENSGSSVDGLFATSETTTNHTQQNFSQTSPFVNGGDSSCDNSVEPTVGGVYEAIYDFQSTAADELPFKQGDLIVVSGKVNQEWWLGRLKSEPQNGLSNQQRMFPANFIKLKAAVAKPPIPRKPFSNTQQKYMSTGGSLETSGEPYCVALYDFSGECSGDLGFRTGDEIKLIRVVDSNWMEGELFGKRGVFPSNFVQVKRDLNSSGDQNKGQISDLGAAVDSMLTSSSDKRFVLYNYQATKPDEISVKTGDEVIVLGKMPGSEDWLKCQLSTNAVGGSRTSGYLPINFLSSTSL
ncbi:uncharacterized protein LOC142334788 isoform X2 [Convolutriloba macropyga]|uniref:uncharacterized protein LOC142334788 isoform X2 n=1 Tax=Convolutriloba macropyga TaxID=536237 RepID=UPI003F520BC8